VSIEVDRYPLGRTDHETERLIRQAQVYGPITRRLFVTAGIGPGMRVLDLGCGAGDVSLLAADLVGPQGQVVGVDVNPEILRTARRRVDAAGWTNVTFVESAIDDLDDLEPAEPFDAVVGRWVLMYQPDPAAAVRRAARRVRPGGIVAFLESELTMPPAAFPATPLHRTLADMLQRGSGAFPEMSMGTKLYGTYLAAGLPAPQLQMEAPVGGGPDWPGYRLVADTVRSLLPRLESLGLASAAELDMATLEDRLRDEVVAVNGIQQLPVVIGAWTHRP
jgi:2-polyprenyl-3-methyl-5-hydroxy-6-metoxy-1,4-benzoquinol methylase